MTRYPRAPLCVAMACMLFTAGCASSSTGDDSKRLARGRLHYLNTCSRCHQPDGRGYAQIYPNLRANPIVQSEDPSGVISIVVRGRGDMPSFAEYPPEELAEIITYIRHTWGNTAGPVTPTEVK